MSERTVRYSGGSVSGCSQQIKLFKISFFSVLGQCVSFLAPGEAFGLFSLDWETSKFTSLFAFLMAGFQVFKIGTFLIIKLAIIWEVHIHFNGTRQLWIITCVETESSQNRKVMNTCSLSSGKLTQCLGKPMITLVIGCCLY